MTDEFEVFDKGMEAIDTMRRRINRVLSLIHSILVPGRYSFEVFETEACECHFFGDHFSPRLPSALVFRYKTGDLRVVHHPIREVPLEWVIEVYSAIHNVLRQVHASNSGQLLRQKMQILQRAANVMKSAK